MFRLFRRLRSGKKKEKEKDSSGRHDEEDTSTNLDELSSRSITKNIEQVSAKPDASKTVLVPKNETNLTSMPAVQETMEIDSKSNADTVETNLETDTFITTSSQQQFADLEMIQKEVEKLEELVEETIPTFSPDELVEAVLFAAGRPLRLEEIIEATELESTEIKRAITRLKKKLTRNSAFFIKEISKELWVLQLKPKFRPIASLLREEQPLLSEDELLVLTHIAYRQPISQAVLTKILSHRIDPARVRQLINNLYLKEYVIMEKRARSIILRTTEKFCRDFGFDLDQRRMKIQLIWRLKRRMRA